jgi:MFS family permease
VTTTRTAVGGPLGNFYVAYFCGSLVRRMLAYATVVYGFEVLGGGQWSGLFYFCLLVPYLLFSLHAGVLIDASSKRRVLQVTSTASLLLLGLLFAAEQGQWLGNGPAHGWLIAAIVFVYGSAYTVAYPTFIAAIPELADRSRLGHTTIIVNVLAAVSMAYAPLVVGALREWLSWPELFGALAALAAVSWVSVQRILFRPGAGPPRARSGGVRLVELVRFLRGHPTLPGLLVTAIVFSGLIAGPMEVLLPQFAERTLGFSPFQAGLFIAFGGTGLVLGSVAALRIAGRGRAGAWLCGTGSAGAALIVLMTLAPPAVVYPLFFLSGVLGGVFSSLSISGTQAGASDAVRGRVMGLFSLIAGGVPALGGALAGVVSATAGTVPTLRVAFTALAVIFVILFAAMKSLRAAVP